MTKKKLKHHMSEAKVTSKHLENALNFMDHYIETAYHGQLRPDSLKDAARSAAELHTNELDIEKLQGIENQLIRMYMARHGWDEVLGGKVAEGNSGNPSIDALKNLFVNYDYWYEMSDDHRIWRAGNEVDKSIKGLIQQMDMSEQDVERIWREAGRKEDLPLERFFDKHKKVYQVGSALKKEGLEEVSDPSGLWSANLSGMGQNKKFKVYYTDPADTAAYKTKIFKARTEDQVIVHFKNKYPEYKIAFVEMTGLVGESRRVNTPRAKRIF